jgi:hypothetical protein
VGIPEFLGRPSCVPRVVSCHRGDVMRGTSRLIRVDKMQAGISIPVGIYFDCRFHRFCCKSFIPSEGHRWPIRTSMCRYYRDADFITIAFSFGFLLPWRQRKVTTLVTLKTLSPYHYFHHD